MKNFRDLLVWQKSHQSLSTLIVRLLRFLVMSALG